ncbi:MAG: hypothetical protein SFU85_02545 [Candidatus Methylacidiphilales bacterium]|nr:hypothetical protein [Candidatus Methylacidiphilales bacterium]
MKAPVWICPDWGHLDTIWRNPLPFILWPVGDEPLLSHWMDHAVRTGAERITLVVADRPSEIRAHFERHQRWSRPVEIRVPTANEKLPDQGIRLAGLPGGSQIAEPRDAAGLLALWSQLNFEWLAGRQAGEQHIDVSHGHGAWIGPRVRIHPAAQLRPPYRIGAGCEIDAGAVIGPEALIGDRCFIGPHSEITRSIILADTCLGERTLWHHRAADGGVVLDLERHLRLDLHDDLVSGRNSAEPGKTGLLGRASAALLWLLLWLPARLFCRGTSVWDVHLPGSKSTRIETGLCGPLILRRHDWLREIAQGHFTWIGTLPRRASDLADVPAETAERLRQARPGLLALSDLHGSHSAGDQLEWPHAAMQLFADTPGMRAMIRRRASLLFSTGDQG